jgi:hypothetical protein
MHACYTALQARAVHARIEPSNDKGGSRRPVTGARV